jgi:hypothetical protein
MEHLKAALTFTWVVLLGTAGYAAGISPAGWATLAVLGVMPIALARLWVTPAPTMSEQIQKALR